MTETQRETKRQRPREKEQGERERNGAGITTEGLTESSKGDGSGG